MNSLARGQKFSEMQTPPVKGCWVRVPKGYTKEEQYGWIIEIKKSVKGWEVLVQFVDNGREWYPFKCLECGFEQGMTVLHVPRSTSRLSLGTAKVLEKRQLGGRWQVLVQLHETGQSLWLPFERLRRIKDAGLRYLRREVGLEDSAERFRLKFLAHALESWNQLTGALDRLDIDPLPHQIHLVHTILTSGNWNWLIADDVGLGKTIEVGLLLSALKRRGHLRRVLIVSPAGLVRQWQDEMKYKFNQDYLIYGLDFNIKDPRHWKIYDHVIVSLDRAKLDEHLDMLQQAPPWDMVIFDEAHKLSRHDTHVTDRYKLAMALRQKTDSMLLLTATPHQGYDDRFRNLLKLVRPDLSSDIDLIELHPDLVSEVILRNRKSQVTDGEGNFIFKGLDVKRVSVEPSEAMHKFNRKLQEYVTRGYRAAEKGTSQRRAIGFVMTTFRKLASSSIAAISRALHNRLNKLQGHENTMRLHTSAYRNPVAEFLKVDMTEDNVLEGGDLFDDEDLLLNLQEEYSLGEFFRYEEQMLQELISLTEMVKEKDMKMNTFIEKIVRPIIWQGKKLLIFTEYRGTQEYLIEALKNHFPQAGDPAFINGSMKLEEKLKAVKRFNDNSENGAQFLVSTEAGGEGLNMHEACHVMVNYDLPWNPARLIQRIGRLYRYGQQERVIVINLHSGDNFDESIIDLMMMRVQNIINDMAKVSGEFNSRLQAEIIGELLENIDLSDILKNSQTISEERTTKEVEEAIERARKARELQEDLLQYASHFDPRALKGGNVYTMEHVLAFVKGMLKFLKIKLRRELYDGQVLELELPDKLVGDFPEFRQKRIVRVTTSRRLAQKYDDLFLLDFEAGFFRYLIKMAKSHDFDGLYASVYLSDLEMRGLLSGIRLRWQNDAGKILHTEFTALLLGEDGRIWRNPDIIPSMLAKPLSQSNSLQLSETLTSARREAIDRILQEADDILAKGCNMFRHPNDYVLIMAADVENMEV